MKLKDLLSEELFTQCKLLTDKTGLENTVDSAMVLEAIDIENWSKKNQLILTSFYAFQSVSRNEIVDFFKKMKALGVSGLVVKMDRLITMIPEWLIELCFEYSIPVFCNTFLHNFAEKKYTTERPEIFPFLMDLGEGIFQPKTLSGKT